MALAVSVTREPAATEVMPGLTVTDGITLMETALLSAGASTGR